MATSTVGISSKVAAGGAAGILTGIIVYVLSRFGVVVPQDLVLLLVPFISAVVGYLTPEIAIVKAKIDEVLTGVANAEPVPVVTAPVVVAAPDASVAPTEAS
jgi:hypothetical protein